MIIIGATHVGEWGPTLQAVHLNSMVHILTVDCDLDDNIHSSIVLFCDLSIVIFVFYYIMKPH